MEKLPIKLLKKFFDKLKEYPYYIPKGSKGPSLRQKFVSKVGMRLKNKAFKVKFITKAFGNYSTEPEGDKEYIDYCLFFVQKSSIDGEFYNEFAGFRLYESMAKNKIELSYLNYRGTLVNKVLSYNELLDLEFEEISIKEFNNILKLFK